MWRFVRPAAALQQPPLQDAHSRIPLLQALNTKLGQLSTAASLFQLALRLEHRRMAV